MKVHHATLPNGLEVVAELDDQALSVATGFFVNTGSRDESDRCAGVSHFLEHMIFKGTERRDALSVNRDLDRIGAKHNAQTSEEDTVYHVTCLPEYLPQAFDVLSDILRPSLREADFETEKQVILEEIEMYQDSPMSVAYEKIREVHFTPHPLAHSVLGSKESIGALTIGQMREYYEKRYAPANMVLAVAGRATWNDVMQLAREHCGSWRGDCTRRMPTPVRGRPNFAHIERPDDVQQTIITAVDAPPLESPDRYAAALLSTILGDHTGSRLYWALIDTGHADAAESHYQDFNQAGGLFNFLSCAPELAQQNLQRVADVVRKLAAEGPTDAELTRAQNKVMARCVLRNERPISRLMSLGFHWTYERSHVSVDDELARYEAVSLVDLRRVLDAYPLWPMTVVSVGPRTDIVPPE